MRIVGLVAFWLLIQISVQGRTIIVGTAQAHDLTTAIALAEPYDTILVPPGSYVVKNLMVKVRGLRLIGQGKPVFDGQMKGEILTLAATDVLVSGITFRNTGRAAMTDPAAIKCLDAHRARILDNDFENTFFGIHISNSDSVLVRDNRLITKAQHEYQLGNGIHLWKCTAATIEGNSITGHRDGIYFEFVTHSLIRGNTSRGNMRYGLHFMFSHDDRYENNAFIANGAGVAVMYTRHVHMQGNVFQDSWGPAAYGLLLKDISDSHVHGNRFVGNTAGIHMEGTSRTVFAGNHFVRNGRAVRLQASCDDNVFERNNFSANTFDMVTNGSIVLNALQGNHWDRYTGYDLDRDGTGDVPYNPVSLFSVIVEHIPASMLIWRSVLVFLLDQAEKVLPAVTPAALRDESPSMRPNDIG